MKIFVTILCIISATLAEPPVGDGYPSAHAHEHSHDHNHENSFQRSISEEYGPPAFGARSISTEYGPPNTRSSLASRTNLASTYGPPSRSLSQEYGTPARDQFSSRSLSSEYGLPESRSSPSTSYGPPQALASLRSGRPSAEYGAPEFRHPSQEYGAPSQRSFGRSPSQKYGAPARNSPFSRSQDFSSSDTYNFANPSRFSGSKSSQFGGRSLSTYGAPARNSASYSQEPKALSRSYGAPRDLSDTYGVPESRGLSQEYGAPSRHGSHKTDAIVSSYSAASSRSPSDSYGVPSARDSMPSDQYGVPDQYSNLNNQGYSYARDSLNELLNQEPANYDFSYKVNDLESGSDFGHTETRQDNRAEGTYFVVLPDGSKQVVEYEADERGFKPRISVEPAAGGYDDNAADLARSGDGPY